MNFPCQGKKAKDLSFLCFDTTLCRKKEVACFLTLWADFADFFHVVFGAVVDGVSHPALGNGLMFGG